MANASAKRVASSNAASIRVLRLGFAIALFLHLSFRLLLSGYPSTRSALLTGGLTAPAAWIAVLFGRWGTPKYGARGELVNEGEDLGREGGLIEWGWDVVYVSWGCLVLTGLFGDKLWYLYLVVPLFALYKLLSIALPFFGLRLPSLSSSASAAPSGTPAGADDALSKRQAKLKKRNEKIEAAARGRRRR